MATIKNAAPPFVNPYKKKGRPLNYPPEELAKEFEKYVKWCEDHPITVTRSASGFTGDTDFTREEEEIKPRLIGIGGFLNFIGEDDRWWAELEKRKQGEEFARVKARIRTYCEDYQKAMASNGIFKENIISRLLGLADKQTLDHKGIPPLQLRDRADAVDFAGLIDEIEQRRKTK